MKAVVAAFNQEKALVGAFSVIVQPVVEPMDGFTALLGSRHVCRRVFIKILEKCQSQCIYCPLSKKPLILLPDSDDAFCSSDHTSHSVAIISHLPINEMNGYY